MGPQLSAGFWAFSYGLRFWNLKPRKSQAAVQAKGQEVWNSAAVNQIQGGDPHSKLWSPPVFCLTGGMGRMLGCVEKGIF